MVVFDSSLSSLILEEDSSNIFSFVITELITEQNKDKKISLEWTYIELVNESTFDGIVICIVVGIFVGTVDVRIFVTTFVGIIVGIAVNIVVSIVVGIMGSS